MREECVQSIQTNNMPYPNHGIEVIYRFTLFDPFERTRFFGYAAVAHCSNCLQQSLEN